MDSTETAELIKKIETNPLWYQDARITNLPKKQFKDIFKKHDFFMGEEGYNWDQWRLPIEYAVIHHTSSSPTISLRELNALGLKLYINQYVSDDDVKNQPIYSGHYWYEKPKIKRNMCFVSYHYIVRPNGKIVQLVDDSAFLWHAGNLDINRRSIGIAFAGKFLDKEPTEKALKSAAKLINKHNITVNKVVGHNEIIKKHILGETTCPGDLFLSQWKSKLISLL